MNIILKIIFSLLAIPVVTITCSIFYMVIIGLIQNTEGTILGNLLTIAYMGSMFVLYGLALKLIWRGKKRPSKK